MSNDSEALDGEVLGEEVGDDGLPGVADYPPDTARGVNDPNLVAPDDVAMREARLEREQRHELDPAAAHPPAGDLVPPDGHDDVADEVQQALGRTADDTGDAGAPAEVAAVRIHET